MKDRHSNCSAPASRLVVLFAVLALFTLSAFRKNMELEIIKRIHLNNLPSASGVEYLDGFIYITGDNSPRLFKLNRSYEHVDQFLIFSDELTKNDTIPKKHKPDFEAMTFVPGDSHSFYIFGSGSDSPTRDVLLKINPANPAERLQFPLTAFYNQMRTACAISDDDLNIEAAVASNDSIFLFNRGTNSVITFSRSSLQLHLEDKNHRPDFRKYDLILPKIRGISAGFSGATYLAAVDKILFTASVEDTENWIADGEVLGSFIGITSPAELYRSAAPLCIPVLENGQPAPIKVESVAILSARPKCVELLLVTDDDQGGSELIEARLITKF